MRLTLTSTVSVILQRFNTASIAVLTLARLTRAAALTTPYPERLIRAAEVGG